MSKNCMINNSTSVMSYSPELVRYINLCTERNWKVLKKNIYPSIYVHEILLEWLKLEIEILLRGIKYEISNIADDDSIRLVQLFYAPDFKYAVHCNVILLRLDYLMKPLKCYAKWRPKCNLFIPFDENYEQNLAIMEQSGLTPYLENIIDLETNWFGISKIRLFEFNERGRTQIERIGKMFNCKYPLYICYAYPWHQTWMIGSNYIPINNVCFDICVRVWSTNHHLDNFDIFDLLLFELANESNTYLTRCIQNLAAKQLTLLKAVQFRIYEYRDTRINFDIFLYFIRRFHSKVPRIRLHEFCLDTPFNVYSDRAILDELCANFNVRLEYDKKLRLSWGKIKPATIENLLQINNRIQKIDISSNYQYFTSDLFMSLLNCKVHGFEIHIDMSVPFELIERDHLPCNVRGKIIYLYNTGYNEIALFLRFLCDIVIEGKRWELIIDDCIIENYDIFQGLFKQFDYITLKNFTPSFAQIRQIKSSLNKPKWLNFHSSSALSDQHLLEFYKNYTGPLSICVRGTHKCTYNFYFLAIEQIMRATGVTTLVFSRPPLIEGLSLPPGQFEIRDHYLHIRDRMTGEFIDIFTFFNNKLSLEV